MSEQSDLFFNAATTPYKISPVVGFEPMSFLFQKRIISNLLNHSVLTFILIY